MSKTPASRLQDKIRKYAKSLDCLARRNYFGPGVEVGWPDVEIFLPGRHVLLIEVKVGKDTVKKIQAHRADELRKLGQNVVTCSDFDSAKRAIDAAYRAAVQAVDAAPLPATRD